MADSAPTAEELLAHTEWLTRLARALVGDAAADDVVQGTYEVALASTSHRRGPLRPWLGGVARNVARMVTRGRVRRERREQAVPLPDDVPTPAQLVARAQVQQKINRLVLELHEPLRSTLLLRFFEGMSAAEIARAQGVPAATVRSRLKDALDRIRAALDAEHGDDRRAWIALLVPVPAGLPHGTTGTALAGAVVVAALVVAGTRIAGVWGTSPTPAVPAAPPAASAYAPATQPPLIVRDAPAIHDDDPKGSLRLEGQVIDEHDAPVAHALVAIDANPPIVVETEGDGAFVFEGLIRRDYRIEATIGDRYAGPARLRLSDRSDPVTLRMHAGGSAEVTVTERASGAPVEGAQVELRSVLTWRATTNARGVAKLAGLGADLSPLVVRAKGYATSATMLRTWGSPATVERAAVSLARGAALAGRVVDERGVPIAQARVVATSAAEVLAVAEPPRDGVSTGADGSFAIPTLSAGTWRITASAGDRAPTTLPITVDGEHARAGIELQLLPGAVVRGKVVDASGAPVPAAAVRAVVQGYLPWRTRRQTFTDGDGAFAIGGLAARAVDVVAWHDGGASAIASVDLAAGRDREVTLKLDVRGTIAGTVVDTGGRPLADAQVVASSDAGDPVRGAQETVTDQGGAFRFAGLPDGSYTVRAARPGVPEAVLWLASGVATRPNAVPIEIILGADGRAVGKVALADGTPATAFTIALGNTHPVPFASNDGTFALPAPAGAYTLTVAGPGFVTAGVGVTIADGAVTDVGTITVAAGRSISGRVLDERGTPVAGATVAAGALLSGGGAALYIKTESVAAKDTETDARGRFVLAGFASSSLTVVAGRATDRSASVQLPPGGDSATLDLVLAPTSGLEGRITRDGRPLGDVMITANPVGAMWSSFFVTTAPDGTFSLDALAPGPYVVYPMLGGSLYLRRTEVVLGRRTKVDIDATPGPVTLAVSAATEAGARLRKARIGAVQLAIDPHTAEELRDGSQLPGDRIVPMHGGVIRDGEGTIEGLQPGTHTLCAMIGDARVASSVKLSCKQVTLSSAAKQAASLVVPW